MTHVGEEVALQPVGLVELQVQLRELVDAGIKFFVNLLDLILRFGQVTKHPIERIGEFTKLVFGLDRCSLVRITMSDCVADITKVVHRVEH